MTYATQTDLVDRFGSAELVQLTDRATPATGAIDTAVLGKALADADDTINSYLSIRYALPLASAPAILKRLAADIARYALYEDRVTEAVQKRYDDAIRFLKDVAAGRASVGPDGAGAEAAQTGGPGYVAPGRIFTVGDPARGTEGTLDDYR